MAQVKKGDYIQMIASMAGDDFSWSPDQVLRVGKEIEVDMATALVNDPPDDPRARLMTKEEGKQRFAAQNLEDLDEPHPIRDVPPERKEQSKGGEVEGEGETRDEQAGMETATNPAAETREKATPQRRRKRVKPPEEPPEPEEDDGGAFFEN